jgi:hypothetical protein
MEKVCLAAGMAQHGQCGKSMREQGPASEKVVTFYLGYPSRTDKYACNFHHKQAYAKNAKVEQAEEDVKRRPPATFEEAKFACHDLQSKLETAHKAKKEAQYLANNRNKRIQDLEERVEKLEKEAEQRTAEAQAREREWREERRSEKERLAKEQEKSKDYAEEVLNLRAELQAKECDSERGWRLLKRNDEARKAVHSMFTSIWCVPIYCIEVPRGPPTTCRCLSCS